MFTSITECYGRELIIGVWSKSSGVSVCVTLQPSDGDCVWVMNERVGMM